MITKAHHVGPNRSEASILEPGTRLGRTEWALINRSHLEAANAPRLRRELERVAKPGINLVLDATRLEFLDGSAVAALVYVRGKLGSRGALTLINVRDSVAELLRDLNVYQLLCGGSLSERHLAVRQHPVSSARRLATRYS